MSIAEGSKQGLIYEGCTSESNRTDVTTFNRDERIENFSPRLQQDAGEDLECDPGIGGPDEPSDN